MIVDHCLGETVTGPYFIAYPYYRLDDKFRYIVLSFKLTDLFCLHNSC